MLVCTFILGILIISFISPLFVIGSKNQPDMNGNNYEFSEPTIDTYGRGLELGIESLTKFSTGSSKLTLLASPEGDNIYIALPPDSEVLNATVSVRGLFPDELHKYIVGKRPNFISGADFDLDGNLDIITTDLDNQSINILYNDGELNFGSMKAFQTGDIPLWGTVSDFNNDGYFEIATANEGANTITVYQNSANGDGNLINRKNYQIGDKPRSITSADFNGDGWVDIASISGNDHKLWINFNQKEKTIAFSDATSYYLGSFPVGITSGDINNDGFSDLITINVGGNLEIDGKLYTDVVTVLTNNGIGEFTPKQSYAVDERPAGVVTDDFNNDGWLDIATSNHAAHNVSILINAGNGDFNNAVNYALVYEGKSGRNLRSGDIDGDGDSDIISICGLKDTFGVLKNNGDGTFARYVDYLGGQATTDQFLGDFDNDGDLDVATSNQLEYEGSVSIIPNNGDGTFSTYKFYYVGGWPRAIVHGDVNNDNYLDLVTANYLGGSLTVCYNDGNGYFPIRVNKSIAVEPFAVIVDHFDGDGYLDLTSADEGLFNIVIVYNDGDGNFINRPKTSYDIGGYPYSILYHDFNGDGDKDLVTSNNAQQSISFLWNLGNGSFAPFVDYSFDSQRPFDLSIGDMDGDGDDDILCTHLGYESAPENNISILWNNGNGSFSTHTSYEVGIDPIRVRAVDIDLDSDLDLITANFGSNTITILLNNDNTTFGSRRDYQVGPIPMSLVLEDLNDDGYLDIVVANQGNNSISILYNQGKGLFTKHSEYTIGAQPTYLTIADFNNDGGLDLAASNLLTNSISVRLDFHYPGDVSFDLGNTGSPQLDWRGSLATTINIPDFREQLNNYLLAHKDDLIQTPDGPAILFPIKVSSDVVGSLEFFDLEVNYVPSTDSDDDGLPDAIDPDDDNDLLPDDWELGFDLNPFDPADAANDSDSDKLTNYEEYLYNTSPLNKDADSDGLLDGEEVKDYNTDPLDEDTDDDGYSDFEETKENTDPLDDSDYPAEEEGICLSTWFTMGVIIYVLIMFVILGVSAGLSRKKKN